LRERGERDFGAKALQIGWCYHTPFCTKGPLPFLPNFSGTPLATTVKGHALMRKIIEYTLISVDGVFAGTDTSGFFEYRDEAYLRDPQK
jgi:hypothetical protein